MSFSISFRDIHSVDDEMLEWRQGGNNAYNIPMVTNEDKDADEMREKDT
jgi:hypothetical protein